MNGSFKVRIHFEKAGSGFSGKLINPSGNETVLDQITCDGAHLHFAVNKLNLRYDGVWNDEEKVWKQSDLSAGLSAGSQTRYRRRPGPSRSQASAGRRDSCRTSTLRTAGSPVP